MVSHTGEVILQGGEVDGLIKVELPQAALSNTDENVSVILEEPHGSPSKLGPDRNCFVTIRHDRGKKYFIHSI